MTVTAVFPLLSATIILYSGILHLLLFLKNQTEKMNFYFVFWCLATTAYSIASAGLYNSHNPDVSQAWQTGQFYSLVLGTPVQILFFREYLGVADRWPTSIFIGGYAIVLILSFAWPGSMFTGEPYVREIALSTGELFPAGIRVRYTEMSLGPIWDIYGLLNVPLYAYYLIGTVQAIRNRDRRRGFSFLAVIVVMLVAAVNDTLIGMGTYSFIYVFEYAFLAYILLMTKSILTEVVQHANTKNELQVLKDQLELLVEERTDELRSTNAALAEKSDNLTEALRNLKETQSQLIQQERLAAVGTMVAGVAHEINTPIGIAVTASTFLEEQLEALQHRILPPADENIESTEPGIAQYVNNNLESSRLIHKSLMQAAGLIESFKRIALDESKEEKRPTNLKDAIEDVLILLKRKIQEAWIHLDFRCPDDIRFHAYPNTFFHVIGNLLENSMTHGFAESDDRADRRITIVVSRESGEARIEYSDNGCGISTEDQAKVFDPFFTTQRRKGRTGLGLIIVHRSVTDLLRGEIRLSSEEGAYTRFDIRFPLE